MKKLLVILLAVFLLAGCSSSNSTAKISNTDEVLFSVNGRKFTRGELNDSLRANDPSAYLDNYLIKLLGEAEGIDVSEYEETAEQYLTYFSYYGDGYVEVNYGGEDAYKTSLIAYYLTSDFAKIYLEENLDSVLEDIKPVYGQYAYFSTQEEADAFLADVKAGGTFEGMASNHGYTNECKEKILSIKDGNLPADVKEYITNNAKGLSPVIFLTFDTTTSSGTTSEERYYVVNITNDDVSSMKDELADYIVANKIVDSTVLAELVISKHNVSVYDQQAYDILAEKYEGIK